MLNEALNICLTGINAVFAWFGQIMDALPGAFNFILAMIGAFSVFRLLLRPVMGVHVGVAGSDLARSLNKEQKKDNSAFAEFKHY